MPEHDSLISIRTVSVRLDLSIRAVYRLIARNEFPPPVKVGGASKFYESDLETYLNRLRSERDER
jgi:excisionase family DNA binding protein